MYARLRKKNEPKSQTFIRQTMRFELINSRFSNHCVDYFNNVSSRYMYICNMYDVHSVHPSLLAFFLLIEISTINN